MKKLKEIALKVLKFAVTNPKVVKAVLITVGGVVGYDLGSHELNIIDGAIELLGVIFNG